MDAQVLSADQPELLARATGAVTEGGKVPSSSACGGLQGLCIHRHEVLRPYHDK